jgi:threonine dehydratase
MQEPTLNEVYAARGRVYAAMRPSPLMRHPLLAAETGLDIFVKHENHNPTGAFKIRGGLNLLAQLSPDERRRGVVSASTGNHGQSIAFASRMHGVTCRIFVPVGNNPDKNAAMRAYGAEVIEFGRDYDEARLRVEELVAREGWRYIHSANEPHLIAGVGTCAMEVFEDVPDLDYLFVPIGGGSGAAGVCLVGKAVNPDLQVIGVQSAQAPAAYLSWREGRLRDAENRTMVEGLSTATAFELPQQVLRDQLDEFLLVSDDQVRSAIAVMVESTRTLVEGAGASALAAALQLKERLAGKRVALICSGANITPEQLREALAAAPAG